MEPSRGACRGRGGDQIREKSATRRGSPPCGPPAWGFAGPAVRRPRRSVWRWSCASSSKYSRSCVLEASLFLQEPGRPELGQNAGRLAQIGGGASTRVPNLAGDWPAPHERPQAGGKPGWVVAAFTDLEVRTKSRPRSADSAWSESLALATGKRRSGGDHGGGVLAGTHRVRPADQRVRDQPSCLEGEQWPREAAGQSLRAAGAHWGGRSAANLFSPARSEVPLPPSREPLPPSGGLGGGSIRRLRSAPGGSKPPPPLTARAGPPHHARGRRPPPRTPPQRALSLQVDRPHLLGPR